MRRRRDGERANNSSRVEGAKEAFGIWRRWGWRQVESGGDDDGGGVVVGGGGGGDGVNVGGVGGGDDVGGGGGGGVRGAGEGDVRLVLV
jgi:hypothetical protein